MDICNTILEWFVLPLVLLQNVELYILLRFYDLIINDIELLIF